MELKRPDPRGAFWFWDGNEKFLQLDLPRSGMGDTYCSFH
jgi:hypothetical protein